MHAPHHDIVAVDKEGRQLAFELLAAGTRIDVHLNHSVGAVTGETRQRLLRREQRYEDVWTDGTASAGGGQRRHVKMRLRRPLPCRQCSLRQTDQKIHIHGVHPGV